MFSKANTNNGLTRLRTAFQSAHPGYDVGADVYYSLRDAIENEMSRRSWLTRIVRSGVLFVVLFELGALLGLRAQSGVDSNPILPFEVFNIVAGAVCLYITWTLWFQYNWRVVVFTFCGIVIAGASYLSLSSGQTAPLLVSVILLLVAAGSSLPWNGRWQGMLILLCLSWVGINAVWSAAPLHDTMFELLGMLAAAALAFSGSRFGNHYRAELGEQIQSLRARQAHLRAELVNCIALARNAGLHVDSEFSGAQPVGAIKGLLRSRALKKRLSLRNRLHHSEPQDRNHVQVA
jgi:hypothetical protein